MLVQILLLIGFDLDSNYFGWVFNQGYLENVFNT